MFKDFCMQTKFTRIYLFFNKIKTQESTRLEIGNGAAKGEDQLVQFGCTYVVSVQSSPVSHPPNNQIVKITVPGPNELSIVIESHFQQ